MFAATGSATAARPSRRRRRARARPMADAGVPARARAAPAGEWLVAVARQRELSLVAIMFVLGGLVTLAAPQFLTVSNFSQVAVARRRSSPSPPSAQAIVVITRNVDLSVEAIIGLVAYCVAAILELQAARRRPAAIVVGLGLGLVLGHDQRRRRRPSSGSRRSSPRSAR